VIGAGLRSLLCTARTGVASCTCAGTARTSYGRRSPRKAGPSGPLASRRSPRKPANTQARRARDPLRPADHRRVRHRPGRRGPARRLPPAHLLVPPSCTCQAARIAGCPAGWTAPSRTCPSNPPPTTRPAPAEVTRSKTVRWWLASRSARSASTTEGATPRGPSARPRPAQLGRAGRGTESQTSLRCHLAELVQQEPARLPLSRAGPPTGGQMERTRCSYGLQHLTERMRYSQLDAGRAPGQPGRTG
jgi:hypothetical protein